MRCPLRWSKLTSTTSSGRSERHSRSRSALHRLGAPLPCSPLSYGASSSDQLAGALGAERRGVADAAQLAVGSYRPRISEPTVPSALPGRQPIDDGVDRPHALDLDHAVALARACRARRRCLAIAPSAVWSHPSAASRSPSGVSSMPSATMASSAAPLGERQLEQRLVAVGEQVERDEASRASPRPASCTRDSAGWMRSWSVSNSSLALGVADHQLAVQHVAAGGKLSSGK